MKKIAVFSDIHGNKEALEAILNDIKIDKFDEVICLGDIINIGPNSRDCLDLLFSSNVKVLLGNHDLYLVKGIDNFDIESEKIEHYKWIEKTIPKKYIDKLSKLPLYYDLTIDNHTFMFTHYFIKNSKDLYPYYGIGTIKRMKVKELLTHVDAEYTFYGHDHEPSNYLFNNKYLIDVGSSGCIKTNRTYYTVIKIDKDVEITKREVEYDRDKFIKAIKKSNYPMLEHYALNFYGIEDLHK